MTIKKWGIIVIIIILATACLESPCFCLRPSPASRNATARRNILPMLAGKFTRTAASDYDHRLLEANHAHCVLLSADKYLIAPEVVADEDELRIVREMTYADIVAILRIMEAKDKHRYDRIKAFVIENFPPIDTVLPEDQYVRDILGRAFSWLSLLEPGRELVSRDNLPADVRPFITEIEPLVRERTDYLFAADFWNAGLRSRRIRWALQNGAVFYEPVDGGTEATPSGRRCLVLDADDVLWPSPETVDVSKMALTPKHLELQRAAKRLRDEQGILLALNSHNELRRVEEIFAAHPDMPLSLDDFAAVRVNTGDKGDNMLSIARELDISPREMVFVDDSPLQRKTVKDAAPEAIVLDIPDNATACRSFLDRPDVFGAPTGAAEQPGDGADRIAIAAERFREKKEAEGIALAPRHTEIITGILRHLGTEGIDLHDDPEHTIAQAFRAGRIRRFLEIGCADCSFLAALAPAAREAGVTLVGIDQDPQPLAGVVQETLARNNIEILTGNATDLRDQSDFDVIVAVGVMSLWGAYSDWQLSRATLNERSFRRSFLNAYDLVNASSRLLSDNPRAAIYANSIASILMLNKAAISKFVDVSVWDDSRKVPVENPRQVMGEHLWNEKWVPLWKQAANFAVLTKKKPTPPITPDSLVRDETSRRDILIEDLIYKDLNEDATFEIKYDISRISPEQREIVEAYIELLTARAKNPGNIRRRPFTSSPGSDRPLIEVVCTKRGFRGEGRVTLEKRDLQASLVRITPMINIALAASTIPDCETKEDLDRYRPRVRYIRNQFEAITGARLPLPDSPQAIINAIRNVRLPPIERVDPGILDHYNRMAKAALVAA